MHQTTSSSSHDRGKLPYLSMTILPHKTGDNFGFEMKVPDWFSQTKAKTTLKLV